MKPTSNFSVRPAMASAFLAASACWPLAAQAAVVRGATAIKVSPNHPLATKVISTANMSSAYVSGVTDFDDYVATTTYTGQAALALANANIQVTLNFDLGAEYDIDRLALWQSKTGAGRLTSVSLYTDTNDSFSDGTLSNLGTFMNLDNPNSVTGSFYATVLNFGSTVHARYVDFVFTSSANGFSMGRVAFSEATAAPVPEPQSLGLMVAGLALLMSRTTKRTTEDRKRLGGHSAQA